MCKQSKAAALHSGNSALGMQSDLTWWARCSGLQLAASSPGQQEQTCNQSTPAGVPEDRITGSLGKEELPKGIK